MFFTHPHVCGDTNHRLKHIYNDAPLTNEELALVNTTIGSWNFYDSADADDLIARLQRTEYSHSICEFCGKLFKQ